MFFVGQRISFLDSKLMQKKIIKRGDNPKNPFNNKQKKIRYFYFCNLECKKFLQNKI